MTASAPLDSWRVAYDVTGTDAPTLAFVHGATSDRSIWRPLIGALVRRRDISWRCVAIDRLGYGESDKPEVDYTMDLFARSAIAVLEQLGTTRAVLVGHSNGVPVVRQVYRRRPELVAGLVLIDGPLAQGIGTAQRAWMRAKLEEPDFGMVLRRLVEQMPSGNLDPEQRMALQQVALATPRHVMLGELEALAPDALWAPDPIDVPLLVIRAAATPCPADEPDYVAALNPAAAYEVWDNVSHFMTLECPDRLAERLKRFVGGLDAHQSQHRLPGSDG